MKDVVAERLVATVKLVLTAIFIASTLGITLGALSVYTKAMTLYRIITTTSIFFASIPVFFLGLMLSLFIGSKLQLLPLSGYESGLKGVKYIILPAMTLSVYPTALIARLTASRLKEIMEADFIRTHFAMGFTRLRIVTIFALKNAMVPILSVIGNSTAILISGAFFVEYIFSWPGIGLLMVDSILRYDFPVIIGIVMLSSAAFVVINMTVDLLYPLFDSRMKIT